MARKRVLIVVNKSWECDPVMFALLNGHARPPGLGWPKPLNHPHHRPEKIELRAKRVSAAPRAVFHLGSVAAEVWCIADLLDHYPGNAKFQSSSELKMRYLPQVFRGPKPHLVVAVGSAGYPRRYSENGSVVAGTKVFMHNVHPNGQNPDSDWREGPFDEILDSSLSMAAFERITAIETPSKPTVADRFLVPPLNPTGNARLIAGYDYVGLASVNVTAYAEYAQADDATLSAFCEKYGPATAQSLETTHALIQRQSDAPFLFVSGITDRVGYFAEELSPRSYAQNMSASHNAGIVVAWMLPKIAEVLA